MGDELVLVTGGSGFLGAHCIVALLERGYRVRTTVRSMDRQVEVWAALEMAGLADAEVDIVAADLRFDAGWEAAAAGCGYVLHTASPFPANAPKDENELIVPARDGALRVLSASRAAGVKRVVLTSSFAAVGYGHPSRDTEFTEADWSNPQADIGAYTKSKALAERAAWDFIAADGGTLELAVVNPVAIIGPVLGPKLSTSIELVRRLLSGGMPGLAKISLPVVDVRDVADLHVRAMVDPAAAGERFLAVAGPAWSLEQMAGILRVRLGNEGSKIPTRVLPNWLVRAAAVFVPPLRQLVPRLGVVRNASNAKAVGTLGWEPRPVEDSLVDTARSLQKLGML
ncbi:SDR family oxidoreductase [Paeniglutamicibacter kerguelensis]|uniref:Dihydroflavonol-4-reductase n=1 Tax=Paeniglutamicibacter kerguelensis TaxID=254788 RepID=A0ABS4XDD9_9MICC|nr:aldehyde reductase [Paeniglutamicibacter kerguelensis]MBP2386485.1 dihydroflavonol-4-reductase [Paeniglutamicibacter kerguelensis]